MAKALFMALCTAVGLITACQASPPPTSPTSSADAAKASTSQSKNLSSDAVAGSQGLTKVEMPVIGSVLSATMAITVKLDTFKICDGTIDFQLNPTATDSANVFDISNLQLKCIMSALTDPMLQKLNIQKMLQGLQGVQLGRQAIEFSDGMMAMARINNAVFTPSRDMLPNFLTASADDLKNMGVKTQHLQFSNVVTKEQGEMDNEVEVTSLDQDVYSANLQHTFSQTLSTEIRATNTTTTHALTDMVPDKITMVLSISPIVILNFNIQATLDKLTGELFPDDGTTPPSVLEGIFNGITDIALVKNILKKFTLNLDTEVLTMQGVDQTVLNGPTKRNTVDTLSTSTGAAP